MASVDNASPAPLGFLPDVLNYTLQSHGDPQRVIPFLQTNVAHLTEDLALELRAWAAGMLPQAPLDRRHGMGLALTLFGRLMARIDFGSRAANLEIALASSETALQILPEDTPSELKAMNRQSLGYAYRNRVRGERDANLEVAIESYRAALEGYSKPEVRREWAQTQNDLGNAYSDRVLGDRADNLARALSCYRSSLEVLSEQEDPEQWAQAQSNLAVTYYQSIHGDRKENLEGAAAAYEAAATALTERSHPAMAKRIHSNLLTVYSELVQAGHEEHLGRLAQLTGIKQNYDFFVLLMQAVTQSRGAPEAVVQFLEENLPRLTEVFAEQLPAFVSSDVSQMPEDMAGNAAGDLVMLGELLTNLPVGNPAANLEIALACLGAAKHIIRHDEAPRNWARVNVSIGDAYLSRIRGNRIENLKTALDRFREAGEAFPSESQGNAPAVVQECIGMVLKDLGIAYRDRPPGTKADDAPSAPDCFERSIAAFESAIALLPPEERSTLWASIHDNLANAYQQRMLGDRRDNLQRSIAARRSAIRVFAKDDHPRDWALVQLNMGADYRLLAKVAADPAAELERAISCYRSALEIFTREAYPGQWASIQNNLGNVYVDLPGTDRRKNLEAALASYEASLQVYRSETTSPERYAQIQGAFCNTLLDLVFEELSRESRSIPTIYARIRAYLPTLDTEVLAQIWERRWVDVADDVSQEGREAFAQGLAQVGSFFLDFPFEGKATYIELGLIGLRRALDLHRASGNPQRQAQAAMALGAAYANRLRGDRKENIETAIKHLRSALDFFDSSAHPERWIECQQLLGSAYFERIRGDREENSERAILCFEGAACLAKERGVGGSLVGLNNSLGMAYGERLKGDRCENLERAIGHYREALDGLVPEDDPKQWGNIRNNLAIALAERGKLGKAEDLKAALAAFEDVGRVHTREANSEQWAKLQGNLGRLFSLMPGEVDKAVDCFRAALSVFTPATNPVDCLRDARAYGSTAFGAGRWSDAVEGYAIAIDALEQNRTWASSDRRRKEILEANIGIYAEIVEALLRSGQSFQALQYVERSKARNLLDLMGNRALYPKGDVAPQVVADLDRLRREIASEQRRTAGESRLGALQQQLSELINREIQPLDPSFRMLQQVEVLSVNALREVLPDKQTALVEWYIGSSDLKTFVVLPGRAEPMVSISSPDDRQSLVQWMEAYLAAYTTDRENWQWSLAERLSNLAALLKLDRLLSLIPGEIDRIVLVPHWFLHLLPLHALPCGDGSQLLDRFPGGIRYAPSIQLLQLTQGREQPKLDEFFGVQNPTGDLIWSDLEVQLIRRRFAPNDEVLEGERATKDGITGERLSHAGCVHFSTHAYFDFHNPLESALLLADCMVTADSAPTDGHHKPLDNGARLDLDKCLTLGDIFAFDLRRCGLVTLSACETGLIDPRSLGDEYIGLPSGFLYAGTPTVVSSLWTVNDLATALLMIRFYDNVAEGDGIARSLSRAQRWLRDASKASLKRWVSERRVVSTAVAWNALRHRLHGYADDETPFREPFHWAAFCAIGR